MSMSAQTHVAAGDVNPATTFGGSGNYILDGDITIKSAIVVTGEMTVDLNGHVIKRINVGERTKTNRFIFVTDPNTKLTIKDSNPAIANDIAITGTALEDTNKVVKTVTVYGGAMTGGRGDRGGAIYVAKDAELYLEGGTIINCKSERSRNSNSDPIHVYTDGCGGAVYVTNEGYFEMNGGSIVECETVLKTIETVFKEISNGEYEYKYYDVSGRGGAVYVYAGGRFKMTGGTIKNNHAGRGGGVYINKSTDSSAPGYFEMTGGTIDGNTFVTSWNNGGGIFSEGTFKMSGGQIVNNGPVDYVEGGPANYSQKLALYPEEGCHYKINGQIVHSFGGGVFVNTPTGYFEMTGGTISENVASSGGGVMVWDYSTFTMHGGVITNNYAVGYGGPGNGGGVYQQTSTFNFNGGTISNNKAIRYGGAININETSTLNINGECNIVNNQASHGGGISQEAGVCELTLDNPNILISGNTAHGAYVTSAEYGVKDVGYGGGLFIEKGELDIKAATIKDNTATGGGGGIALRVQRIIGDINVIIEGGSIINNVAGKSGGGLDLFADCTKNTIEEGGSGNQSGSDIGGTVMNKVEVQYKLGVLSNNKSVTGGGGINISINKDNSTATMVIGDDSEKGLLEITGNETKANDNDQTYLANGGGVCMNNGTLNIIRGHLFENNASNNGGAVYLGSGSISVRKGILDNNKAGNMGGGIHIASGSFKILDEADIHQNSAKNGGGISVNDGSVEIVKGTILKNTAENYGGGLFIYNTTSDYKQIKFNGGNFIENSATLGGGGVCAIGKVDVIMNATIENNTAYNGGGIYMGCISRTATEGAKMNFGSGIIKNNYAKKNIDNTAQFTTAYQGYSENLNGIGGGVFMGNGTQLSFSTGNDFGLYKNIADNGADDIFANGHNTKITLPVIRNMHMQEYTGPKTNLFWMEDYLIDDTEYSKGTLKSENYLEEGIYRYRDAQKQYKQTYTLNVTTPLELVDTYVCLALGYELVYVKLTKKGLKNNDDAAFNIYYKDDETSQPVKYVDVLFTGVEGDADVSRIVALPTGKWKFEETEWAWRYDNKTDADEDGKKLTILPNPNNASYIEEENGNKYILISNDINRGVKAVIITNVEKKQFEGKKLLEHSHRKVNRIKLD